MSHFFVSKFLTQNSVVVFKSRYKGDFPPFRSLYPPHAPYTAGRIDDLP